MRWTDSITNSVDMTLSKLPEIVKDRGARWAIVHGVTKSWTWLSDWTTTTSLWHPLTPGSKDRRRLSLGEAVTCAGEILQGRNQGMNAPSFLILCLLSWYLLSRYQSPSTSQGARGPRLMHIIEVTQGFPGGSDGKESTYNAGDPCLIPGSGRSLGEENDYLLLYSCLENSMDREAWQAIVHGVSKESDMTDQLTLPPW